MGGSNRETANQTSAFPWTEFDNPQNASTKKSTRQRSNTTSEIIAIMVGISNAPAPGLIQLEHLVPSWWNLLKVKLTAEVGHWGQAGYSLALLPAQPTALSLPTQRNRATAPSCFRVPQSGTVPAKTDYIPLNHEAK